MKRWFATLVGSALLSAALLVGIAPSEAQAQRTPTPEDVDTKKRAQTGMKFLQIPADPRAVGMGNAVTASNVGSPRALFNNPATMARTDRSFAVSFMNMEYIAEISHSYGAALYQPGNGQYGVIGASVQSVDYGEVIRTIRANNEKGFMDVGSYKPSAIALGIGYARNVTDRFTVGGQVKYVQQDMGAHVTALSASRPENEDDPLNVDVGVEEFSENVIAYDFGVVYDTGFRSLRFAMSTRNFAPEFSYVQQQVEIPLTFRVGLEMDLMDLTPMSGDTHSLIASVEGRRPRDFSEQVRFGGEYTFMDLVSLRAGYAYPSEEHVRGLNLGAGLQYDYSGLNFRADYSNTEMGLFDRINRIGVTLGF